MNTDDCLDTDAGFAEEQETFLNVGSSGDNSRQTIRRRTLHNAFIDGYRRATGLVDRDIILYEYDLHSGSLSSAVAAYRQRKKDAGEEMDLCDAPDLESSPSQSGVPIFDASACDEMMEQLAEWDKSEDANDGEHAKISVPSLLVPHVFKRERRKPPRTLVGERLLKYALPLFKNDEDCHRTLMLWFEVGDYIQVDSYISRALEDRYGGGDGILFDLYGKEGLEMAHCHFDTRADVYIGSAARMSLTKFLLCIDRYAHLMGLHTGLHIPYQEPSDVLNYASLYGWIDACEPSSFRSDLIRHDEKDKVTPGYTIARHKCFNGMMKPVNRGLPCTCWHCIELGSHPENTLNYAERLILTAIEKRSIFSLQVILNVNAEEANTDYLGILPIRPKRYNFSNEELRTMRRLNEQVYDLPKRWEYFSMFTETMKPDRSFYESRTWSDQSCLRLVRLAATYSDTKHIKHMASRVYVKWDIIEQFTLSFPAFFRPFKAVAFQRMLDVLCRRYGGELLPMVDFIKAARKIDWPKDPPFDSALAFFKESSSGWNGVGVTRKT